VSTLPFRSGINNLRDKAGYAVGRPHASDQHPEELVPSEKISIRPVRPDDLGDLYRICLRTADSGQDATALFRDPMLPGHLYVAPYAVLEPSLTFVAVGPAGVSGYVVGALDSAGFAQRLEERWWPRLRPRYPDPPASLPEDRWTRDQRFAHLMHHPYPVCAELAGRYPSHLHINLLPPLQGQGAGRRLIETLTGALRAQGSPGVHLHVGVANPRAAGFYARVGFTEIPSGSPGARRFVMPLGGGQPGDPADLRQSTG
jgi:ribosomal protein S18 acetylase RimI-like enzyme